MPGMHEPTSADSRVIVIDDELSELDRIAMKLGVKREPSIPALTFGDESKAETAEQLLREFDALPPEERRLAFAKFFGVDADRVALVRKGNELKMTPLSSDQVEHMKRLGQQGYKSVTYTNRKQRRAAKAQARHAKR